MTQELYFGFKDRSYAEEFEELMKKGFKEEVRLAHSVRTRHEVVDVYNFPYVAAAVVYLFGIERIGGNTKIFSTGEGEEDLGKLVKEILQTQERRQK